MLTYDNNTKVIVNEYDFDEDKDMDDLVHTFQLVRLGKKLRENSKLMKDLNLSSKPTHKKSKNTKKWEEL